MSNSKRHQFYWNRLNRDYVWCTGHFRRKFALCFWSPQIVFDYSWILIYELLSKVIFFLSKHFFFPFPKSNTTNRSVCFFTGFNCNDRWPVFITKFGVSRARSRRDEFPIGSRRKRLVSGRQWRTHSLIGHFRKMNKKRIKRPAIDSPQLHIWRTEFFFFNQYGRFGFCERNFAQLNITEATHITSIENRKLINSRHCGGTVKIKRTDTKELRK